MHVPAVLLVGLLLPGANAPAQTTGAQKPTPPPAAPAPSPPTEPYTYQPAGRRDPFLSLLGTGTESRVTSKSGEGPGGMSVADISVKGVMQSQGAMVAMIQGPDKKTYVVHKGDKLLDGRIKSISAQGLVVDQEVTDPLSLVKHREVTKLLRSAEGGRE
jgi:Tfp pilus assembly protein PilP